MDDPSSQLILPLYTLISICKKPLFFNKNVLQVNYPGAKDTNGTYYEDFLKSTFGNDQDTILRFEEFLGLAISSVRDSKHSFFMDDQTQENLSF